MRPYAPIWIACLLDVALIVEGHVGAAVLVLAAGLLLAASIEVGP